MTKRVTFNSKRPYVIVGSHPAIDSEDQGGRSHSKWMHTIKQMK